MKSVKNNQRQAVRVLRHTIMVDGRVILPSGEIVSGIPDTLVYTPQVSQLIAGGVLEVEGVASKSAKKSVPTQTKIPLPTGASEPPEEPVEDKEKPKKRRK